MEMGGVQASSRSYVTFATTKPAGIDFFPKLKTLRLIMADSGFFLPNLIFPWLTPNFHRFECYIYPSDGHEQVIPDWVSVSPYFLKLAPSIEDVTLEVPGEHATHYWATNDSIAFVKGRDLVKLVACVQAITVELLNAFSEMPRLRSLSLECAAKSTYDLTGFNLSTLASLQSFSVWFWPMQAMTRLLSSSSVCLSMKKLCFYGNGLELSGVGDLAHNLPI